MVRAAALALALAFASATSAAAGSHLPALTVADPVIRVATPAATSAAGYLSITNDGDTAYRLTGIEGGAPSAELHESVLQDGVMRMEPRPEGFEIAPGETLLLERGGRHVMFTGLERGLAPGSEVKATLIFADEVRIPVTFTVTGPEGAAPAGAE